MEKFLPLISGVVFIMADYFIAGAFALLDNYAIWAIGRWLIWPMVFDRIYFFIKMPYKILYFSSGVLIGVMIMSFIVVGVGLFYVVGYLFYTGAFGSILVVLCVFWSRLLGR